MHNYQENKPWVSQDLRAVTSRFSVGFQLAFFGFPCVGCRLGVCRCVCRVCPLKERARGSGDSALVASCSTHSHWRRVDLSCCNSLFLRGSFSTTFSCMHFKILEVGGEEEGGKRRKRRSLEQCQKYAEKSGGIRFENIGVFGNTKRAPSRT